MKAANPHSAIKAQIKATVERLKQGISVGYWIDEIARKEIRFFQVLAQRISKKELNDFPNHLPLIHTRHCNVTAQETIIS